MFHGLQILPESISLALRDPDLDGRVTGRFVMDVRETPKDPGSVLALMVECTCHPWNDFGLAERLRGAIVSALRATHPGYKSLHDAHGAGAEPAIRVVEPGCPELAPRLPR
jgi:hypothetical protein